MEKPEQSHSLECFAPELENAIFPQLFTLCGWNNDKSLGSH